MAEPMTINLVLLRRRREAYEELHPALRAAFREVETFFNLGERRAMFRCFCLAAQRDDCLMPVEGGTSNLATGWRRLTKAIEGDRTAKQAVSTEEFIQISWETMDSFARIGFEDTYDVNRIVTLVQDFLGRNGHEGNIVVVTDLELTPPPDQRYIIWKNGIISILPMDPKYWGIKDPDRIAIVKHRIRTVSLCNVGMLLGLTPCNNECCFLYRNVDSVRRLDGMVELGQEHGLGALAGRGYEVLTSDPSGVQSIKEHPLQARKFYER